MGQQWTGPHLDQDFIIIHTPCSLFQPKPHDSFPKANLNGSLDLFVPLLSVAILNKIFSLLCSCLFSWFIVNR